MNINIFIKIFIYLVIAGISFLFYQAATRFFSGFSSAGDQIEKAIDRRLKNKQNFTPRRMYLSQQGIMYRLKDYNLSPAKYIILRVFVGVMLAFFVFVFLGDNITFIVLAGVAGYYICDVFFRKQNQKDNKEILDDIFNIYLTLKIQLSSNIYIINSLLSAREIIKSQRLKEAVDELIANLSDKTMQYTTSVQQFKYRFNSEEINNLCAFLLSYMSYGVSEKYLRDVMSEINEIATESSMQQESAINTKVSLITFAYFASILAIVIYCAISSFGSIGIFW